MAGVIASAGGTGALQAQTLPVARDIIVDLRENSLSAEEIRGSQPFRTMEIVSLADFEGRELQVLQDILRNTEDGFAEVRTAMEANEMFEAALRERNVPISDVTAATYSADGIVTVYTNVPSP
ncbi:hypothetical protein ABGN05_17795 [Aquibium sp. LZ166]|uniref:DUF541 domain-containing protein n=1 Tax=Aquibium pacificus TaxID=3153579 RepID=A0ABV3SL64_9HYPH